MGPRVVLLVVLHERQHPQHAAALLARDAERAGRQRARSDQVEVGDAARAMAPRQPLSPLTISSTAIRPSSMIGESTYWV
jgi:hypothetical protein